MLSAALNPASVAVIGASDNPHKVGGRPILLSQSGANSQAIYTLLPMLARAGMPVIEHRLCRDEAELRAALATLGPDVVLKACSADLPHKSDHGLVAMGLPIHCPNSAGSASAASRSACASTGSSWRDAREAASNSLSARV